MNQQEKKQSEHRFQYFREQAKRMPHLSKEVQIEWNGRREVEIEGCDGILEYCENEVSLSVGQLKLKIWGNNLEISAMDHNGIIVQGLISGMEYCN